MTDFVINESGELLPWDQYVPGENALNFTDREPAPASSSIHIRENPDKEIVAAEDLKIGDVVYGWDNKPYAVKTVQRLTNGDVSIAFDGVELPTRVNKDYPYALAERSKLEPTAPKKFYDPYTQTMGEKPLKELAEKGTPLHSLPSGKKDLPEIVELPIQGDPDTEGRPWIYRYADDTLYIAPEGAQHEDMLDVMRKELKYPGDAIFTGILWKDGFSDHFQHDIGDDVWERVKEALSQIHGKAPGGAIKKDYGHDWEDDPSWKGYNYGGGWDNEWWDKPFRTPVQKAFLNVWESMRGKVNSYGVENTEGGYDSGSVNDIAQKKDRSKKTRFNERNDAPHFRWSFTQSGKLDVWPVENGHPDHFTMFGSYGYNLCSQGRIYMNDDGLEIMTWPGRPRSWKKTPEKKAFQDDARHAVLRWTEDHLEATPDEIYFTSGSYGDMMAGPGGRGHVIGDIKDNHRDTYDSSWGWQTSPTKPGDEKAIEKADADEDNQSDYEYLYGDQMPNEIPGYEHLSEEAQNQMWADWSDSQGYGDEDFANDEDLNGPQNGPKDDPGPIEGAEPTSVIKSHWTDPHTKKKIQVSTVDLKKMGLHPRYETMIFGGEYNGMMFKWDTNDEEEVKKHHQKIVSLVEHHTDPSNYYESPNTKKHSAIFDNKILDTENRVQAFIYFEKIGLVTGDWHQKCVDQIANQYGSGVLGKLKYIPGWIWDKSGYKVVDFTTDEQQGFKLDKMLDPKLAVLALGEIKKGYGPLVKVRKADDDDYDPKTINPKRKLAMVK